MAFYNKLILQIIINNVLNCANNIGSLVNNLFVVKVFNPVLATFLFWWFNFTLSAIVSSGSNLTIFSSPSSGGMLDKSPVLTFTQILHNILILINQVLFYCYFKGNWGISENYLNNFMEQQLLRSIYDYYLVCFLLVLSYTRKIYLLLLCCYLS